MQTSYRSYEPMQHRLLPDALEDGLPEGHLTYFISDSVDSLDLSAFHARYANWAAAGFMDTLLRCEDETGGGLWKREGEQPRLSRRPVGLS